MASFPRLPLSVFNTEEFVAFQYIEGRKVFTMKMYYDGKNSLSYVDYEENKGDYIEWPDTNVQDSVQE